MIWHSSEKKDVVTFFNTDENNGLSSQKVDELKVLYSEAEQARPSVFKIFLSQFSGTLSIITLALLLLSVIVSVASSSDTWILSATAAVIIMLGTAFNTAEIYLSNNMKRSIKAMRCSAARVLRDGTEATVSSSELIPGDILLLSEGELIPADARLIETNGFRCDEYVLTGETVDVEKDADAVFEDIAPTSARQNMVFADCCVMHGTAKAVVTEVGSNTEARKQKKNLKIAKNSEDAYQTALHKINKYSLTVSLTVAALIFILTVIFNLQQAELNFSNFIVDSLFNSIALIISAVPETLPASVAIILWTAVQKLNNSDYTVTRSATLQNAANISVICAEKTGVLTPDNMSVAKIYDGRKIFDLSAEEPNDSAVGVVKMALVCGNSIDYSASASQLGYDSSVAALESFCDKYADISIGSSLNLYPMAAYIPFDADRRVITSVNMIGGQHYSICKGAAEAILPLCDNANYDTLIKLSDSMAAEGLRVIAVAIKPLDSLPAIPSAAQLEEGLSFLGLIAFADTLDGSIISTVAECNNAGIRTVMLTGDSLATAKAVAERAGITLSANSFISGEEIRRMSDEELDAKINMYSVFARINAEDKYRIVKALQHNNEAVAVTGSRRSDAPVLRKADLGITPRQANDVVKYAADVAVKNTAIPHILEIIKISKDAFFNIRKIIHYFLSCNIGELAAMLMASLFFGKPALISAQILLINFITDVLPAITLSLSPTDDSVIYTAKRSHKKIFPPHSVLAISVQAFFICCFTLIAYGIGSATSSACGQTMALAVLGFCQILHILPSYTDKLLFKSRILSHKLIFLNSAVSVIVLLAVLLTPLKDFFGMVALSGAQWWTVILLPLAFMLTDELIKIGFELYNKYSK